MPNYSSDFDALKEGLMRTLYAVKSSLDIEASSSLKLIADDMIISYIDKLNDVNMVQLAVILMDDRYFQVTSTATNVSVSVIRDLPPCPDILQRLQSQFVVDFGGVIQADKPYDVFWYIVKSIEAY